MLVKIKCPKCNVEGTISLLESNYEGPYRCWKCREMFSIALEAGVVKSCEPLSEEEFQKAQEVDKLRRKFRSE
jgi:hypothetical protein